MVLNYLFGVMFGGIFHSFITHATSQDVLMVEDGARTTIKTRAVLLFRKMHWQMAGSWTGYTHCNSIHSTTLQQVYLLVEAATAIVVDTDNVQSFACSRARCMLCTGA